MTEPGSSQSVPEVTPEVPVSGLVAAVVSNPPPSDDTNPIHSQMKVTHALGIKCLKARLWARSVKAVMIARNVYDCITHAKPGTKGNAVAMSVLLEKIPEQWAEEIVCLETSKEAFEGLE